MPLLPRLDELAEEMHYSDTQVRWIFASVIIVTPTAILALLWLIYNSWTILYKQGRWRVLPLTTFYVLSLLLVLFHIYSAIMFAVILLDSNILLQLIYQTLMFAITID